MATTAEEKNTDICNLALAKIGQHSILNINSTSIEAGHCRLHLPQVRQKLLRNHPWNFAERFIELPVSDDESPVEWFTRFSMPSDYMQLVKVWLDGSQEYRIDKFDIVGRSLYTDNETCFIKYIADVCDPLCWEPSFTDCVITALAAEICIPIGSSNNLKQSLLDELINVSIPQAYINNAWEDSSNENNSTEDRINRSSLINQNNYTI